MASTPFVVSEGSTTWYDPNTLDILLDLKKEFPQGKIVVGNSEVGIEQKFKNTKYPVLIGGSNISELKGVSEGDENLTFGANTPLSDIAHFCESGAEGTVAWAMSNMLRWFASTQIRNTACLAGNLATASPISDMNPMLAASNAAMTVKSKDRGSRSINVSEFFLSYRKTAMQPDEVIVDVKVPKTSKFEYVYPYKQAKRREDDISIVTSGMRVRLAPSPDGSHFVVAESSFAFGGMSFKTVMAPQTSAFLLNKPWTSETLEEARKYLKKDLPLPDDVPGGQPEYRRTLAASFLFKFFVAVSLQLEKDAPAGAVEPIKEDVKSASESFVTARKPSMTGTQRFPKPKFTPGLEDGTEKKGVPEPVSEPSGKKAVGKDSTHQSGALHCTGEAKYTDDIGLPADGLEGCLVHSTTAGCDVKSIDISEASSLEGVVKVVLYEDLVKTGGNNKLGPVIKDEEVSEEERSGKEAK